MRNLHRIRLIYNYKSRAPSTPSICQRDAWRAELRRRLKGRGIETQLNKQEKLKDSKKIFAKSIGESTKDPLFLKTQRHGIGRI